MSWCFSSRVSSVSQPSLFIKPVTYFWSVQWCGFYKFFTAKGHIDVTTKFTHRVRDSDPELIYISHLCICQCVQLRLICGAFSPCMQDSLLVGSHVTTCFSNDYLSTTLM